MTLLKELATIREGAVKRAIMDKIEKAIEAASKKGLDPNYRMALTQIADNLCRIDKGELTTGMTMGELRRMIEPHYSKEEHEKETVTEDATKDEIMNTICHLAQGARLSNKSYDSVVKSIAAKFRTLDKHDASKMSDEALNDMIRAYYDEDQHLAQDNAITNVRDVSFDYKPVRESDGEYDNEAEWAKAVYAIHGKGNNKSRIRFMRASSNSKSRVATFTHSDNSESVIGHWDYIDKKGTVDKKPINEEEYKDRKAEAIGLGTKWFKDNFKKFELPLHVKRIPSSGNYIMASKVTGDKSKWVYIKWVESDDGGGTIKQTSSKEWKITEADGDGGNGSLDNQQQAAIPAGAVDPNQGPEGAEAEVPAGPRVIAKAGDFKVQLGKNEQIQIIDGKGSIRLTMPMVIWKELTRQ
jgi:hypothetical protein